MHSISQRYFRRAVIACIAVGLIASATLTHAQTRDEQPQLAPRLQERIINLASNVGERTEAALNRLENIARRIESRIGKMEAGGIDVSTAQERFSEGKVSLGVAKTNFAGIENANLALSSEDVRGGIQRIMNSFKEIRMELMNAHQAFTDTVRILKELNATKS